MVGRKTLVMVVTVLWPTVAFCRTAKINSVASSITANASLVIWHAEAWTDTIEKEKRVLEKESLSFRLLVSGVIYNAWTWKWVFFYRRAFNPLGQGVRESILFDTMSQCSFNQATRFWCAIVHFNPAGCFFEKEGKRDIVFGTRLNKWIKFISESAPARCEIAL